MSEMCSAALAPVTASASVGLTLSADSTDAMTCVSLLEPFGEQRPERPVHDAAGEDLLVPLPPLALEEAARDLTGGEGLLDVLAGEREEVEARAFVARHGRDEHDALAVGDEDGAVRLLGETARLEGQRPAVDGDRFTNECHGTSAPEARTTAACGETPSARAEKSPQFLGS